jgi:hypothetical protein
METMEKPYKIKIRAYGYWTEFDVKAINDGKALEDAIVDKLGKNDIVWDKDGFTSKSKTWLTYEEVIDGTRSEPLHEKKESRTGVVAAL